MASKGTKKRPNIGIDEEKDVFLSSINKKLRNARKKMDAIEELEKKDRSTLKPEQLDKLKGRAETLESIKYNEGIKDLYYAALKAAQDEGKGLPQQETATRKKTEEDKTEEAAPVRAEEPQQQAAPVRQEPVRSQEDIEAEKARITRDILSKVVNLVHFAQLFRDQSSAQEFRQNSTLFGLDSVPDLESFHEFYVKVFTFSESDKFGKVGDKVNESVRELESYINAAEQPALRNRTYKHLQNVVENVSQSSFFRDRNADVAVPKSRVTEPSAIGSELSRKGHEQQEAPAPVQQPEKTKSPEKPVVERSPEKAAPVQAQPQAQTQTQGQGQAERKDWGALEDEESDEDDQAREDQAAGEERADEEEKQTTTTKKADDDGFTTVTAKHKEKKEENPYRGSGTRGRGGRGGYRGEGGRGGYRGEGGRGGYRGGDRREGGERREGEGQEGGYRPRPRRDEQQGEGEGGYRPRGGYRGQGRGNYRGGDRREGERREGEGGYRGGNEQRTAGTEAGRAE